MGDRASNIAEITVYLAQRRIVRHQKEVLRQRNTVEE